MTGKASINWSDLKSRLADFDRADLVELLRDMYAASKENQAFLHARFCLGDDVLRPYKTTIARWLWPDAFRNQHASVAKAKKSIADYKKAIKQPEGLAELMVFYCEQAAGFIQDIGYQDGAYFDALLRMFEQALKAIHNLPVTQRQPLRDRLDAVRCISHNFGYGVGDTMESLYVKSGADGGARSPGRTAG